MKNIILILNEDNIALYEGLNKRIFHLKDNIEPIQLELTQILSASSTTPMCLYIDRNQQDVHEEELPALWPWDRIRLLSHKREEWKAGGGVYGYRMFTQENKTYLQWINILPHDTLALWIAWIKSLPQPFQGIFFISLEAEYFLHKYFPLAPDEYQVLIYKIASPKMRQAIFKGKRLLLFRSLSTEEDLRTSLHFLQRSYPDIHEKLHILNLTQDMILNLPNAINLSDSHVLIDFLRCLERPSLSLNLQTFPQLSRMKSLVSLCLMSLALLMACMLYYGIHYKRGEKLLLTQIEGLKMQIHKHKLLLKNEDVSHLKLALDHYHYIKDQRKNPFGLFTKLSRAIEKHHLKLENFIWSNEEYEELEIGFCIQDTPIQSISEQFQILVSDLETLFPHVDIYVIEAPFQSGTHQTFTYPLKLSCPFVQLRMRL